MPHTTTALLSAGMSRRDLLSAAAILGGSAALSASLVAASEAKAANYTFGSNALVEGLGVAATITGRHKNLFRTFSLTGTNGVLYVTYGGVRYMATVNTGDAVDVFQVFNADTGRLVFKGSTPAKGSGNLTHDGKGNIYFSSSNTLMKASLVTKTVTTLGKPKTGVTTYLNLAFDYLGRLWATTYPAGVLVRLDPATGLETYRTARVGTSNQYTKGMGVSPDKKTFYVGTGTADPDLFSVDAVTGRITRIGVPDKGKNSIVAQVLVRGRKVFVWYKNSANVEQVRVYDTVSKTWVKPAYSPAGRAISEMDSSGFAYLNSNGRILKFKPNDATLAFTQIAVVGTKYSLNIGVLGAYVYVVKDGEAKLTGNRLTTTGTNIIALNYAVSALASPTQSMVIDPKTNIAYAGGYRGDGLCSTNLATGEFKHSPSGSKVAQIEGMIVDGTDLYVGSYGHAQIVKYDTAKSVEDLSAYTDLGKFGVTHHQDRPFAWASTTNHIAFGTVPLYGYANGALGVIDRTTGAITIHDTLAPNLSIVGLTSSGDIVYGTTSILTGYGSENNETGTGSTMVFAFNVVTKKMLWKRILTNLKETYGPVLMNGTLYVASINSIISIRTADGVPTRTFKMSTRDGAPGWQSVKILRIPNTNRLIHLAGGVLRILDTNTAQQGTAIEGLKGHLGLDRDNNLWATMGNDIVKLKLTDTPTTGDIHTKYLALGGASKLGYPTTAETDVPLSKDPGRYQSFARWGKTTRIYTSATHGTHAVDMSSALAKKWVTTGKEHRGWGMPSTDLMVFTGGSWQEFTSGTNVVTLVTTAKGTFAARSWNIMGKTWNLKGRENGWGWPMSDEYYVGTELRQDFSKGITAHYLSGKPVWTTTFTV